MKVSITCQLKKEEDWMDRYFARLTQLGRRYGWGEVKKFPRQTLSCIKNALNKKQIAFSSNKI